MFWWYIRSTISTDGSEIQGNFVHADKLWEKCHDKIPANISNIITADLFGIYPNFQLFERAMKLTKVIADDNIASDQSVVTIVDARYKCEGLSDVNEIWT